MILPPNLHPGDRSPEIVRMVVEIPKDSSNKYEYDWSLGVFRLSRALYSPIHYPGDYGFIPGTIAEDREPLDVLCLVNQPSFTGCLTEVRPVAVLDMLDGNEVDQKILAVPVRDPRYQSVTKLLDLQDHARREIEHFFLIYKELESHVMRMRGWCEVDQARKVIEESRSRYLAAHDPADHETKTVDLVQTVDQKRSH